MARAFLPGLELARHFYRDVAAPLLDAALDGVPYSAALIGWGSDVQGFDTERSTDHAWGPRLEVFLAGEDFPAHAGSLDKHLDRELPDEYRGHPVRFAFPHGTAPHHWVHIHNIHDFFTGQLNADLNADPTAGLSASAWLMAPTQTLRELTGGQVFHDGTGLLEDYRRALSWYPADVWRYILACQWKRLAQEEAFVGRCGEVGDEVGSAVVAARQVRDLMKLCLLMSRVYPPYSKWLGTAFASLTCAAALTPVFADVLSARTWKDRERHLSSAYEIVAALHNDLELTEPLDPSTCLYYSRPFQVLGADRFHDALLATISDPALRDLPPVGAIDQYVDSTDLIDRNYVDRRTRYIAGPGLV